jgi:hypothetical protein
LNPRTRRGRDSQTPLSANTRRGSSSVEAPRVDEPSVEVRRIYAGLREDDSDICDALRREHGAPMIDSTSVPDSVVQGVRLEKSAFVPALGVAGVKGEQGAMGGDNVRGRRTSSCEKHEQIGGGERKKTHLVRISKSVPTSPRRH